MKYDFDQIINRTNTNCLKYDFASERGKPADILPLWVADMDFQAPKEVLDTISNAALHGIFGYSDSKEPYFLALANWFKKHHNWSPDPSWLVKTPGVVYALATAIKAYTNKGDSVLIQQPVYYPFFETIINNDRKLVNNPLVRVDDRYTMDFEDFEHKIVDNNVKLFILCSPHNPVGRVWTREELIRLGDICLRHNVIVVSDEIHCDFTYEGHTHYIFAGLKPEYEKITITCTAPSKTFNLAGLQVSNIFIADPGLRFLFESEMKKTGYCELNSIGIIACQSAYESGEIWLNQLKVYLANNLSFVEDFINKYIPQIKLQKPEGTYLVWLDCKELGLNNTQLNDLIVNKAGLWLDCGSMFGSDGVGYQRINIACPLSVIELCMNRLKSAVDAL